MDPHAARRISVEDLTGGRAAGALAAALYERDALHGISLVAAEFPDSQIRVHGPRGCTSQIIEAFNNQARQFDYYHFGMEQRDVVFGGLRRLEPRLRKALEGYDGEGIMFLVTTCAAELIGDDVDELVRGLNGHVPLLKLTGGIQGDRLSGINQTLAALVTRFAEAAAARDPGRVNLVGNVGSGREWRADVGELQRLLEKLGLRVNPLACESRLAHVAASAGAAATGLVNPDVGGAAAEWLAARHGVAAAVSPLGLPLGLRGTERWLRAVGAAAGAAGDAVDRLIADEESSFFLLTRPGLRDEVYAARVARLPGLPFAVVADGTVALSWARLLHEEFGMRPALVACHRPADPRADELAAWWQGARAGCRELSRPTAADVRDALAGVRPALVLGSSVERDLARDVGAAFLHVVNPNTHYVTLTDAPFLGYRGLGRVAETVLNLVAW